MTQADKKCFGAAPAAAATAAAAAAAIACTRQQQQQQLHEREETAIRDEESKEQQDERAGRGAAAATVATAAAAEPWGYCCMHLMHARSACIYKKKVHAAPKYLFKRIHGLCLFGVIELHALAADNLQE